MASLCHQLLPPTNLGQVDEEMIPPGKERRDWDVCWRSPDDRRNRNWRDAEVLDQQNDRSDNYRSTYGNGPQRNYGLENRNRIDRNNRGFESINGWYQFRNRSPSENFDRGYRRHGGRLKC
ncbi:uncharacterized protein TNCV_3313661 [Trichonephila clavipes]|nr:uncharacterized protein TNCV_3313661 [Trichonephila clavipes]